MLPPVIHLKPLNLYLQPPIPTPPCRSKHPWTQGSLGPLILQGQDVLLLVLLSPLLHSNHGGHTTQVHGGHTTQVLLITTSPNKPQFLLVPFSGPLSPRWYLPPGHVLLHPMSHTPFPPPSPHARFHTNAALAPPGHLALQGPIRVILPFNQVYHKHILLLCLACHPSMLLSNHPPWLLMMSMMMNPHLHKPLHPMRIVFHCTLLHARTSFSSLIG